MNTGLVRSKIRMLNGASGAADWAASAAVLMADFVAALDEVDRQAAIIENCARLLDADGYVVTARRLREGLSPYVQAVEPGPPAQAVS